VTLTLRFQVRSSSSTTKEVLDEVKDQTLYNTVLSLGALKETEIPPEQNEILYPPDESGETVLASIASAAQLPKRGQLLWDAGGRKTLEFERNRSASPVLQQDSMNNTYWQIVQGPVMNDWETDGERIDFDIAIPPDTSGMTISYWVQWLRVEYSDAFVMYLESRGPRNCNKGWYGNCSEANHLAYFRSSDFGYGSVVKLKTCHQIQLAPGLETKLVCGMIQTLTKNLLTKSFTIRDAPRYQGQLYGGSSHTRFKRQKR